MGSSSTKLDPVVIPLIHGESVLDVGCGYGRWGNLLFSNYWEGLNGKAPVVDGIDAFAPSVAYCKKLPCYRKVWTHQLPNPIKGKWDVVLASEIIEHIPQKDVGRALAVLESAAKKRVVLTTPAFQCLREGGETHFGFNDFEAHKSYVTASYLRKKGYTVLCCGFGNPNTLYAKFGEWLLRPKQTVRQISSVKPSQSGMPRMQKISFILESLGRVHPYFATFLVAYKDMK